MFSLGELIGFSLSSFSLGMSLSLFLYLLICRKKR